MVISKNRPGAGGADIVTLPSSVLNNVFGKVSYSRMGSEVEVMFTILLPHIGEGWRTGVALDASSSMRAMYGRALTGTVPDSAKKSYRKKGWIKDEFRDGVRLPVYQPEAYDDAISLGYLKYTNNEVEPKAREFLEYLARNLDAEGSTTLVYWACGDGSAVEEVGSVSASACAGLVVSGPQSASFGTGTKLAPAVRFFDQKFSAAENAMFVFVTDGKLDDLADVRQYTVSLAQQIEAGTRNPVKCILVGLGQDIDEDQMIQLDDLDTGTEVDIWDHKIAADMRELAEIFAELVDESQIVAPVASIYDAEGNCIVKHTDGLPARVVFRMPVTSKSFMLEVPGLPGQGQFEQSLLLPGKNQI